MPLNGVMQSEANSVRNSGTVFATEKQCAVVDAQYKRFYGRGGNNETGEFSIYRPYKPIIEPVLL